MGSCLRSGVMHYQTVPTMGAVLLRLFESTLRVVTAIEFSVQSDVLLVESASHGR